MSTVGFIGVGVMGLPMARNLIRGGHQVRAFDINTAALGTISRGGAETATSAKHAAQGAEFVVTMLPTGDHVTAAVFGPDGAAEALGPDSLLIDMSTGLPATFDAMADRLESSGRWAIDAPVGRTSKEAQDGTLLIVVGGHAEDVGRGHALSWIVWETRSSTAVPAAPASGPSSSTTTCRSCPTAWSLRRLPSRRPPAARESLGIT